MSLEDKNPDDADECKSVARLLMDDNRFLEAEKYLRRALAIDEVTYGPDHPEVAINLKNQNAGRNASVRASACQRQEAPDCGGGGRYQGSSAKGDAPPVSARPDPGGAGYAEAELCLLANG